MVLNVLRSVSHAEPRTEEGVGKVAWLTPSSQSLSPGPSPEQRINPLPCLISASRVKRQAGAHMLLKQSLSEPAWPAGKSCMSIPQHSLSREWLYMFWDQGSACFPGSELAPKCRVVPPGLGAALELPMTNHKLSGCLPIPQHFVLSKLPAHKCLIPQCLFKASCRLSLAAQSFV